MRLSIVAFMCIDAIRGCVIEIVEGGSVYRSLDRIGCYLHINHRARIAACHVVEYDFVLGVAHSTHGDDSVAFLKVALNTLQLLLVVRLDNHAGSGDRLK